MSWRDMLTPSYRPRPLHSTTSSRECVSLRSTYTPSSSFSTSISRTPTTLRRRASEATVTVAPKLSSYCVSSYSRYRPTGGTLIDLPTVDPYDLPRRYRSSYDRDEYKRVDYSRSAHSTATPDYSRQDSSDRYRKDYITPEYTKQDSSDRYRDRAYSITRDISYSTSKDSRREPKEASSAVDVALNRTSEAAETAFEIVVMKKEWTAVARSIREIREVRLFTPKEVDPAVLKVQEKRQKDIKRVLDMREEVRREEEEKKEISSYRVEEDKHLDAGESVAMTVPRVVETSEDVARMEVDVVEPHHEVIVEVAVAVEEPPKKKLLKKKTVKRVVPVLPDVVMRKVFSSLTYRELCRAEVTCTRWQKLIIDLLRRDIQEITIERFGSSQIIVVHQPPFKRLNITCPAESYDFLTGVVRRSRLAALKLTTDLHFLSNMDKLAIDLSPPRLRSYFANVDDLWLIIVSISEEEVVGLERIAELLFSQLANITMQCHVHVNTSLMIARCVKSLTRWYGDTDVSLEIHSDTAEVVYDQLTALSDLSLYKLKLICTEFDSPELCITAISQLLAKNRIRTRILTFRDWSIRCDSSTLLTSHPMEALRISSCDVLTVDDFLKAMIATEKQDAPDPKKARIASKEDLKPSRKRKMPFIRRFEIAGQCRLRGLEFLTNKAHKELEKMLATHFPLMEFDCSEIYYFE
ncbi:hypothetical protein PRIPAC_95095 [Pristionchus pacificus]|uniref:F-box domain-containing protein n=1 Tax=Pristionchus pacificus TaxID=54126 RepID=A0A2A6CDG3_PRIPA|nr:hypothetical protein PRIPAC_95095 [Pristionchus pacificus]|eukprot:PDM76128.1 F-box domain-containing protein [Pristionchus pacificus]